MSANTVNAWVSILGCRNWLPVSKIIWKRGSWCEVVEYSDGLTDTDWIEWECAKVVYDSETTCVEENDNIYILRFSEVDGTYRVYDFSWTDVTWTVTPIKCVWAEQFDIRSAWFYCIDWITTLERFDIIDLTTSTVSSSIWQDLTGTVVSSPVWTITAWACDIVESISVIEQNLLQVDAMWNPTWWVVKEVRKYSESWSLISTEYIDSVTWLPVLLSPSTEQLFAVWWLQKEPIVMCDSWTSFIRHYIYNYWTSSIWYTDTLLDWTTPYTVIWTVIPWACSIIQNIAPWWIDITIDLVNIWWSLTSYWVPSLVRSITLSTQEDTDLQTPYWVKKLYADKSYTRNQWTESYVDISSFNILTDLRQIEVIFDI